MIAKREFEGDRHHIQAKHAHPTGAVALLNVATGGQRSAAIKDADVVKPKKATLEDVVAFRVLAIDPPGKVEQQFVKHALQEHAVSIARLLLVNFVNAPGGPGKYRWIDVAKGPLVGGKLTVGMHVPLSHQQVKLALGKFAIN